MGPFSVLLFDLDDTVVEFTRVRRDSFIQAASDLKVAADGAALYQKFCEESDRLWEGHRAGNVTLEEVRVKRFRTVLKDYPVDAHLFTERFYDILSTADAVMPGAVEATRALAKRYTLVGISNGRREVQEKRMAHVGLKDAFSFYVGPEDCGFAKPHPGLFLLALARAGNISRERAMVVGDGLETDIQGASNLNMASCWLNPEGLKRSAQDPVPSLEVRDLTELCQHLL
ncbi:MAG: HAD family hydrolase [Proteobacteria bacterium]|nr:MAG: HAD family hydrolase [Pseudomonadota bacterium]